MHIKKISPSVDTISDNKTANVSNLSLSRLFSDLSKLVMWILFQEQRLVEPKQGAGGQRAGALDDDQAAGRQH